MVHNPSSVYHFLHPCYRVRDRGGDPWEMRVKQRKNGGSLISVKLDFNWHGVGLIAQTMAGLLGEHKFFGKDLEKTVKIVEAEWRAEQGNKTGHS